MNPKYATNMINIKGLYNKARILAVITLGYNLLEGIFAVGFGAKDETLALFGFGVDSFVEVISAIGIIQMVLRIQKSHVSNKSLFEIRALKITGIAFYILTTGLLTGAGISIYTAQKPDSSLMGIIISVISIVTMYFLYSTKLKTGRLLDSAPIIADANCTRACFVLSFILLGSSVTYQIFFIPYIDAIGSLGIAWYAFKEGREAFEKAATTSDHCDDC